MCQKRNENHRTVPNSLIYDHDLYAMRPYVNIVSSDNHTNYLKGIWEFYEK